MLVSFYFPGCGRLFKLLSADSAARDLQTQSSFIGRETIFGCHARKIRPLHTPVKYFALSAHLFIYSERNRSATTNNHVGDTFHDANQTKAKLGESVLTESSSKNQAIAQKFSLFDNR
jgi:hypothetical protein